MQSDTCSDGCQDEYVILARGQRQFDGVRMHAFSLQSEDRQWGKPWQ